MYIKKIIPLIGICLLSGCGINQPSTDAVLEQSAKQTSVTAEPENEKQQPVVQVLPNSPANKQKEVGLNIEPSKADISKLYQCANFVNTNNVAMIDFVDCNKNIVTVYSTSEMSNALKVLAGTEKYLFDIKTENYDAGSGVLQTQATAYAANAICIETGQLLYNELLEDESLQDLVTTLSISPSQSTYDALYRYIQEKYPDKISNNEDKLQPEYFSSLIKTCTETLSQYPFLKSVSVYSAEGTDMGTYTAEQASALQVLGEYTQYAIEAAVEDIYIDNNLDINLSQLEGHTWYRLQDPEHEEWIVSIYNDLNANVLITQRSKQTATNMIFVCGLNIDQASPAYQSQGNIIYDILWQYVSSDEDVTKYIDENEYIRISKTSENKVISYPANTKYIYNDTNKPIFVTASTSDPAVLNAPVYVKDIPAHTIAGLSSANADAFIWQYP